MHLMRTPSIHPNLITFPLLVSISSSSFTLSSTFDRYNEEKSKDAKRKVSNLQREKPQISKDEKCHLANHQLIEGWQRWLLRLVMVSFGQSLEGHIMDAQSHFF